MQEQSNDQMFYSRFQQVRRRSRISERQNKKKTRSSLNPPASAQGRPRSLLGDKLNVAYNVSNSHSWQVRRLSNRNEESDQLHVGPLLPRKSGNAGRISSDAIDVFVFDIEHLDLQNGFFLHNARYNDWAFRACVLQWRAYR